MVAVEDSQTHHDDKKDQLLLVVFYFEDDPLTKRHTPLICFPIGFDSGLDDVLPAFLFYPYLTIFLINVVYPLAIPIPSMP